VAFLALPGIVAIAVLAWMGAGRLRAGAPRHLGSLPERPQSLPRWLM
jgi:hypothetical protein